MHARQVQYPLDIDAQRTVDDIVSIQPVLSSEQYSEYFYEKNYINNYDVNKYFAVLDKLRPADGYVMDWTYNDFYGAGGKPVLYMRHTNAQSILKYEDYKKILSSHNALGMKDANPQYSAHLEKINVDDSPEGYFQLIVLNRIGPLFYLIWHSRYEESYIVCSQQGWIEQLQRENQRKNSYRPPSTEFVNLAQKHDFAPKIDFKTNYVDVSITTYGPFYGLNVESYRISRRYPHWILKTSQTNIFEQEQSIVF